MLHYNGMMEKILVLDDEPLILKTIERALVKIGYSVRIAHEAKEFMRLLRAEPSDLLLMDMNLGNTYSLNLLDEVGVLAPEAKVIFMSGLIPEREDILFLEKPFTIDELRALVREVLDGKTGPGAQ